MNPELMRERHAVLYHARLSVLYHRKRERFFDLCEKMAKAVAIIGGAATFTTLMPPVSLAYIGAGITITSTLSLVFGLASKARLHADLARDIQRIEAKIVALPEPTHESLVALESELSLLESGEPRALASLVVVCQNELAIADNQPEKIIRLGIFRRIFAQFLDLPVPNQGLGADGP